MKTREIIWLIVLGVVHLYCAKVLMKYAITATADSFDAFYSILAWSLYLVGWTLFLGGNIAFAVKLVMQMFHE